MKTYRNHTETYEDIYKIYEKIYKTYRRYMRHRRGGMQKDAENRIDRTYEKQKSFKFIDLLPTTY